MTPADIVDKVVYVLANPVTAGLVPRGRLWPGLWSAPREFGAAPTEYLRPSFFFRKQRRHRAAGAGQPEPGRPSRLRLGRHLPPRRRVPTSPSGKRPSPSSWPLATAGSSACAGSWPSLPPPGLAPRSRAVASTPASPARTSGAASRPWATSSSSSPTTAAPSRPGASGPPTSSSPPAPTSCASCTSPPAKRLPDSGSNPRSPRRRAGPHRGPSLSLAPRPSRARRTASGTSPTSPGRHPGAVRGVAASRTSTPGCSPSPIWMRTTLGRDRRSVAGRGAGPPPPAMNPPHGSPSRAR